MCAYTNVYEYTNTDMQASSENTHLTDSQNSAMSEKGTNRLSEFSVTCMLWP